MPADYAAEPIVRQLLANRPGPEASAQLRAFITAIADGTQVPTSAANAVPAMRLIDDAYRAAGLAPR